MNMKGGVGKTTVCMHLAGALGYYKYRRSRKILAIDYDPQFNLSQAYISPTKYFSLEKSRKTTLSVLVDDDTDLDPFDIQLPGSHTPPAVSALAHTVYSFAGGFGLDIVPSTLDLMYLALGQTDLKTAPMEERFEKLISEARGLYDVVLIDCHPAGSLFTKTSLRNSDHVLIPVAPTSSYAVRGIGLMMNFVSSKKVGNAGPKPHILFNSQAEWAFPRKKLAFEMPKT